ncbi:MAG: peptidoglycan bridge formation glycyltransferase FemA/FemB family protein [Bacilli bacterium]|nr:peptidoglycan bridge formation glycyltransferase FemA/FemB family protein [Bacilli bacterium]
MENQNEIYTNSIFEQKWWLDLVAFGHWKEIIIYDKGNIVGRFAYYYKRKGLFNYITMPMLTQTLGMWIEPAKTNMGNNNLSHEKRIINEILDNLPKHSMIKITLDHRNKYVLPFLWRGFSFSPTFSYRFDSLNNLDEIYSNFHSTVKKNIKRASKEVLIVNKYLPDNMFSVLDSTFMHQKRRTPYSQKLLLQIMNKSIEKQCGFMISAYDNSQNLHACSFFVYDRKTCFYLLSGSDPKYRTSGAQTLILWEAIKFAAYRELSFDFEGSNIEGIEQFVRRFGSDVVVNYEIRKLPLLFEIANILKPRIKKMIGYKL